jgi:sarcosine oxidase, subunit delta
MKRPLRLLRTKDRIMLLINCPWCGKRAETEFRYGGEAHLARPKKPAELDDKAWSEFLFVRTNARGPYAERWIHQNGCQRWFNVLRNTYTDAFIETGQPQPSPVTDDESSVNDGRSRVVGG